MSRDPILPVTVQTNPIPQKRPNALPVPKRKACVWWVTCLCQVFNLSWCMMWHECDLCCCSTGVWADWGGSSDVWGTVLWLISPELYWTGAIRRKGALHCLQLRWDTLMPCCYDITDVVSLLWAIIFFTFSGVHVCFTCKKSEGEVRRCCVLHCGRFYHEACVRLSALTVFENRGFRCPLHTCLSCHYSGRGTGKATKGTQTDLNVYALSANSMQY